MQIVQTMKVKARLWIKNWVWKWDLKEVVLEKSRWVDWQDKEKEEWEMGYWKRSCFEIEKEKKRMLWEQRVRKWSLEEAGRDEVWAGERLNRRLEITSTTPEKRKETFQSQLTHGRCVIIIAWNQCTPQGTALDGLWGIASFSCLPILCSTGQADCFCSVGSRIHSGQCHRSSCSAANVLLFALQGVFLLLHGKTGSCLKKMLTALHWF